MARPIQKADRQSNLLDYMSLDARCRSAFPGIGPHPDPVSGYCLEVVRWSFPFMARSRGLQPRRPLLDNPNRAPQRTIFPARDYRKFFLPLREVGQKAPPSEIGGKARRHIFPSLQQVDLPIDVGSKQGSPNFPASMFL